MTANQLRFITTALLLLIIAPQLSAQTKRIKRPRGSIGVYSADKFVRESFDIYDKVYMYDGYAEAGKPLTDDDIYVLENAMNDAQGLLTAAPNVIADLDGAGAFKQAKGITQINRAKKALKYCIETIPKLLKDRKSQDQEGSEDTSDNDNGSDQSDTDSGGNNESDGSSESDGNGNDQNSTDDQPVNINSKFDFVPGDELIFYDDFSNDFIGDFPSKWNTNGTGEVVTFGEDPTKWLELKSGYGTFTVPDITSLPEDYTIEFDVRTSGINRKTSSAARLTISLEENNGLRKTTSRVELSMNYPQFIGSTARIYSRIKNQDDINNGVDADMRELQKKVHHYSIAVNKRRVRLWVNQRKVIDVPRALPEMSIMNGIKLNIHSFIDKEERVFISKFKVAKGGVDLRRKLMSEGSVSTNGILFDSGSSTIKAQSYGIIKQISQVLQQDKAIKLQIVGHTDSDGDDDSNLALSKSRAEAVKQALISVYGVDSGRLTTDGKGESDPVADNSSAEGKAQNRRVVFVKQ